VFLFFVGCFSCILHLYLGYTFVLLNKIGLPIKKKNNMGMKHLVVVDAPICIFAGKL
jgi:hypothetical protein